MRSKQREKHYILDEELTRLTIESAGKTIDWMINTLGVPFQPEVIVKDGYGTFPTIHLVEGEGSGLREPFEKAVADRSIDVRLNTEAKSLNHGGRPCHRRGMCERKRRNNPD